LNPPVICLRNKTVLAISTPPHFSTWHNSCLSSYIKHQQDIAVALSSYFRTFSQVHSQNCEMWLLFVMFVLSVCPSVRPSPQNNLAPTGQIVMKFVIPVCSKNLSIKFKFHYNMTRITRTIHEDLGTFLLISCSIPLTKKNGSDKSSREIQNTHFMFKFFPKTVPFMKSCRKLWQSQTGPRWQYNMGYVLGMLDN
jgi:hypothetical protein